MTLTEKKLLPLGVGDDVKCFNDGMDGHPVKWAYGEVTEVGDESFVVQWEDLDDPTEYEWSGVDIVGNRIYDPKRKNGLDTEIENCLGYALRFWNKCNEYKLYYHPGHVINSPVDVTNRYWLPAEDYGYNYFKSAFDGLLTEFEQQLLKTYFNE